MTGTYKTIWWMSSPLAFEYRGRIDAKFGKYLRPKLRKRLNPTTEYYFFSKIRHWTLEVDGWCYELRPVAKERLKLSKVRTDSFEPCAVRAEHWHAIRNEHGIRPEREKVGVTILTHEGIESSAEYIWANFNHGLYFLLMQNCQTFVMMLHEMIALSAYDPRLPATERLSWNPIPKPLSYTLADFSQQAIKHVAGAGICHLVFVPLVPQALGYGVVGALGTTQGIGVTGTTGAATTAGTSHGTVVGAGKLGAGAGKATLGAKVVGAGASHGVVHAAGAAKVVTAAKVGTAAKMALAAKAGGHFIMLHPAVAIAAVGLGVLAFGKRDRGWPKRHPSGDPTETEADPEVSVFDSFVAEDKLLSHADSTGEGNAMVEE